MKLSIRFSQSDFVTVEVDPQWSVGELTHLLLREYKPYQTGQSLRIIFQGRVLKDNMCLQNCYLSEHSTLDVVPGSSNPPVLAAVTAAGGEKLLKVTDNLKSRQDQLASGLNQISEFQAPELPELLQRPQFFVFCKVCDEIGPGRLRVRCQSCKQGTLVVHKDPCSWSDVLNRDSISGDCQNTNCHGTIAEFFFRCCNCNGNSQDSCVALDRVLWNTRNVACLTCEDDSIESVLVFPCEAGHSICLDCFKIYCQTRLDARTFLRKDHIGYTLPCPANCDNSCIKETHHFHILGKEQYMRYQRFGAEDFVIQEGGILCPQPDCGMGLFPDTRRVTCMMGCRFVFCRDCKEAYHEGPCQALQNSTHEGQKNDSEVDALRAQHAEWNRASLLTIEETTKPCPGCQVNTEKNDGCMHMTCPKCNYQWCWLCNTAWSRRCQENHWFQ